jgi:hypothetical protein
MQTNAMRFLVILVLLTVTTTASSSQFVKANEALLSAMSPFEDIIEYSLAGNDSCVSKALIVADQQVAVLSAVLIPSAASQLATLMADLHGAATDKDHGKTASIAVGIFRMLIDNLHANGFKEPREVSLLDYAGFNLRVLAAARNPDWQEIRKMIAEAAGWWNAIESRENKEMFP